MALKDYEPIEQIGSGGFGTVYSARHVVLRRIDALKVLDQIGELRTSDRTRFARECVAMAKVDHPNVTRVYDAGTSRSGKPWLAMELLPGGNLAEHAPLDWAAALAAVSEAADGLQAIHDVGIVHRDIKGQNLLRSLHGSVKVADLGIAVVSEGVSSDLRTRGLDLAGSLAFMAPELFDGRPASVASDVYALGATLHQLLAGAPPFVDGAPPVSVVIRRILHDPVDSPSVSMPQALRQLIIDCMAKDPHDRPGRAADVRERLLDVSRGLERPPARATAVRLFELPDEPEARPDAEQRLRRGASGGDLRAMARLAALLMDGGRTSEGEIWLTRAAMAGHPSSMYHLGLRLRDGGHAAEGRLWLSKASDAGHLLAHAQLTDEPGDGEPRSVTPLS